MKRYSIDTIEAGINDVEEILKDENTVEIHIASVLFGLTIFRDKRMGKTCIATHNDITCFDSVEQVIGEVKKGYGDKLTGTFKTIVIRATKA